jgi:hypothetical protein
MSKFFLVLLVILFLAAPLVALLSFHEDCSQQACHILMTNLFIITSVTVALMMFLTTQIINKVFLFETLYNEEIFLPPRL